MTNKDIAGNIILDMGILLSDLNSLTLRELEQRICDALDIEDTTITSLRARVDGLETYLDMLVNRYSYEEQQKEIQALESKLSEANEKIKTLENVGDCTDKIHLARIKTLEAERDAWNKAWKADTDKLFAQLRVCREGLIKIKYMNIHSSVYVVADEALKQSEPKKEDV